MDKPCASMQQLLQFSHSVIRQNTRSKTACSPQVRYPHSAPSYCVFVVFQFSNMQMRMYAANSSSSILFGEHFTKRYDTVFILKNWLWPWELLLLFEGWNNATIKTHFSFLYFFFRCYCLFWDLTGAHYVDHVGLKLTTIHICLCKVLGLKVCTTLPSIP